jgi:EAL domain-containing protein (putative c-di-GMP-specific phosphodiesterase class I)
MSELREAIKNDELELHYQPKIDLDSGTVSGFEALVRWVHSKRGFIPPDEFIPMAEETGVIAQLSRWVLRNATQQSAEFAAAGYALGVSINLSANDLLHKGLAEEVGTLLEEYRVSPARITLEVTESAMMRDPEQAMQSITRISKTGVKFSIDDFGTGYSSLAYLKKLPVAEIKIDKSFVRDMQQDNDDATIVQSTIDLAHNLGLSVVAEGVENREIMRLLTELGCDIAQGYHVARPMSVSDTLRWLRESPWRLVSHTADPQQVRETVDEVS